METVTEGDLGLGAVWETSSLKNLSMCTEEAADQEALEVSWEPQAATKEM